MRIVLLTIYDQTAYGPRCIAAAAKAAGHEVLLITFKRHVVRAISREDPTEREAIAAAGHLPLYDVTPFFDVACPFPTPVTDAEIELLLRRIERFAPDVLGLSLTSAHLPLVKNVSARIRERFPRLKQVWGGIHPTMDPVGCLEHADAVCVGEGDDAFVEYLANPNRTDIRNFYFRDGNGGHIANPLRPLIQDLDRLPMAMFGENETLIDEDRDLGMSDFSNKEGPHVHLVIASQRGCPFSCSYCLHCVTRDLYAHQKYLRRRRVDRFLDEVEHRVRQYQPEWIYFWDEIFMIGREWIEEFCEKYPKRIGVPFAGYAHPQTTSKAMLEMLAKAGLRFVSVGIQSGSERIRRDIYDRPTSNADYIRFGHDLIETGFDGKVVYDMLTSCPFEREDDLRATIDLLSKMPKAAHVTLKRLVFFPFTRINNIREPRVNLDPQTYLFYDMLTILAGLPGVPPAILPRLADDAHLKANPEILQKWAQEMQKSKEERESLEGRIKQLEAQLPWGIKRAARHLLLQIDNRVAKSR